MNRVNIEDIKPLKFPTDEEIYKEYVDIESKTDYSKHNYLHFLLLLTIIPEDYSIPEDYKESLKYCLDNLISRSERCAVKLRYFAHYTTDDVAEKYNITNVHVRSILAKAKRNMSKNEQCMYILLNGLNKYQQSEEKENL